VILSNYKLHILAITAIILSRFGAFLESSSTFVKH